MEKRCFCQSFLYTHRAAGCRCPSACEPGRRGTLPHPVALDRAAVELDAETGALRQPDRAVAFEPRSAPSAIRRASRSGSGRIRAPGAFGIDAAKCSEATSSHRAGEGVRRHHAVMRLGQRGDAPALGKPARPGDVGLHDVDRAAGDQLAKAVKPDLGLVAGDRGVERVGDPGAAVDIVGRDRLLDPDRACRAPSRGPSRSRRPGSRRN